jgi:quinohemoprotein ethanol dehydrogenase
VGIDLDAGSLPQDPVVKAAAKKNMTGHLAAWDPATQREVWRAQYEHPWNGGVLSTAGNLVFQGTATGELNAYQADSGKRLWSHETQAGVLAPPITYQIGSEQYITVEVGWGGAFGLAAGELARDAHLNRGNLPRVLAFKLNGTAALPSLPAPAERPLQPPSDKSMDAQTVAQGKALFHNYCGTCHGDSAVSGGVLPDLRYSAALSNPAIWKNIVLEGSLKARGMASFAAELDTPQIEQIRAYVIRRANESMAESASARDSVL